jgi:hypothetical protein
MIEQYQNYVKKFCHKNDGRSALHGNYDVANHGIRNQKKFCGTYSFNF